MPDSTTIGVSDSDTLAEVLEDAAASVSTDDTRSEPAAEAETDTHLVAAEADTQPAEPRMNIVIRQVLERQIAAGQALSSQLLDAATEVTTAVLHAPATFAVAIQDGETIATAWSRAGSTVHGVADEAGSRARAAVTSYVGHQATLPVAVLGCAGEIAGALASAQGTVAGSALDGVFAVATAASAGENVRQALGRHLADLRSTAAAAGGDLNDSVKQAGLEVRQALGGDLEPLVAAITGVDQDS